MGFVGLRCCRRQVHLQPETAPYVGDRTEILGQAAAAEPEAGLHVHLAQARIQPDAVDHRHHVRVEFLAQDGQLIGVRELQG